MSPMGGSVSGGLRFECPVEGGSAEAPGGGRGCRRPERMGGRRGALGRGRRPGRKGAFAKRSRSISAAMASSIRRPTSICASSASGRTTSACAWGLRAPQSSTPCITTRAPRSRAAGRALCSPLRRPTRWPQRGLADLGQFGAGTERLSPSADGVLDLIDEPSAVVSSGTRGALRRDRTEGDRDLSHLKLGGCLQKCQ